MNDAEFTPLDDEAVRRFITDGYLIIDPGIPSDVHERIDIQMLWTLHKEGNPGNNILPAIPEMHTVLESPRVRGALTAILGPNYVLHPHRFAHNIEPAEITTEGAKVGAGSHSFVGWHQDDHSPLARPRHHYFRYAMLLYYPQDTPIERGPTQLIPGTYLNQSISDADRARGFQAAGPAGTCILVHFDTIHGGSLNVSDRTRNMVKFVFARTEEPSKPWWNSEQTEWQTPAGHRAACEMPAVWRHLWNWLRGAQPVNQSVVDFTLPDPHRNAQFVSRLASGTSLSDRVNAANALASYGEASHPAIPALIAALDAEEPLRQTAIYSLASIGVPAVAPLAARLIERPTSGWNEGAVVMEDAAYALAAVGQPAVPVLQALLYHPSEWVRINALFALGEMGPRAAEAMPAIIGLLRDESQAIVRTALDAIGQIKSGSGAAVPDIRRLLCTSNPDWQQPLRRAWTAENQVRTNAMMTLLRLDEDAENAAEFLADVLEDECGYVGGFGVELLLRLRSSRASEVAVHYLVRHRWDSTLRRGIRTY